MKRAALVLALLGATLGPVLDGLHTWSGATWYPEAQWFKSVWWCPPLFSFAALSIGIGRLLTERVFNVPLVAPGARTVTTTMTLFVVAYAFSGFATLSETFKAVLLLITFVVAWWRFDFTRQALLGAVGAGLGGWLVEHTLVGAGLFFHRDTMLDGVALWIPPLYFVAALAIGHVAKQLAETTNRALEVTRLREAARNWAGVLPTSWRRSGPEVAVTSTADAPLRSSSAPPASR